MNIFGVDVSNRSQTDILDQIEVWLLSARFHRIVTINPEFLLLALKNKAFHGALLSADLRVADGVGLYLPFWLGGEKLIERVPGADLLLEILHLADKHRLSVGLLLAPDGLSSYEEIQTTLA